MVYVFQVLQFCPETIVNCHGLMRFFYSFFVVSVQLVGDVVSCLVAVFISFNFISNAGLVLATQYVYSPTYILMLDKGFLDSVSVTTSGFPRTCLLLGYIFLVSSETFDTVIWLCTDHVCLLTVQVVCCPLTL